MNQLSDSCHDKVQQLKWVRTLNENASKKGIKRPSKSDSDALNILTSKTRSWSDLRQDEGRTGFFTKAEDEILQKCLREYFASIGSTWDEGIKRLVEQERQLRSKQGGSVWTLIAQALPQRRVSSVMFRVQSQLYPWTKGKWTDEDNQKLITLYDEHPSNWKRIGFPLKRYWRTVRDHFKAMESTGKVDLIRKLLIKSCTESSETGGDPDKSGTRKVDIKSKNRPWTTHDDEVLLETIKELTGVQWPLSNIPWEYISRRVATEIPQRSRAQIRSRYVRNLIPHKEFMKLGNELVKRQLVRYIWKLIKRSSDLHWSEIEWSASLPYWPGIRNGWTAKQMILDEAGHGEYYLYKHKNKKVKAFFDSGKWKAFVKPLYKRLLVKEHAKDDMVEFEVLLSRLRESNGGQAEDWGELPSEGNIDARKNYSRKKRKTLNVSKEEEMMENLLKLDPNLLSAQAFSDLEDISFL